MLQLNHILDAVDQIAPWDLAESWDRVGLQIGDTDRSLKKIMVALDLNHQVLDEGLQRDVDGFLVHHPLIFKPVTSIHPKSPTDQYLATFIKKDLFLIAAHTNIDKAAQGLNQYLADLLELEDIVPIEDAAQTVQNYKIVVFTPEDYATIIRKAMADAGAGIIGDYHECSFGLTGLGTFKPNASAKPFIGQVAEFNEVKEIRLEMVVGRQNLPKVMNAVITNHPYEEPAVDVYPLMSIGNHGLGRIGKLKIPVTFSELCLLIRQRYAASAIRVVGEMQKKIHRVAICSGSGGSLLGTVIQKQVDAYITGDLSYHDFLRAKENNLAVIDAGHWTTEHHFIKLMTDYLQNYFNAERDLEVIPSSTIQVEPYLTLT